MKCPRCQGPMTLLFLSTVCDRCDPPGGAAGTAGGFYAWTYVPKDPMILCRIVYPTEELARKFWLSPRPGMFKLVRVESSEPFRYNERGCSEEIYIFPHKPTDAQAFDSRYAGYQHAWVVS